MTHVLKRFLVFQCAAYYPSGGMDDLIAHTNTLDAAKYYAVGKNNSSDTIEIYDSHTGEYHTLSDKGEWRVSNIMQDSRWNPVIDIDTAVNADNSENSDDT